MRPSTSPIRTTSEFQEFTPGGTWVADIGSAGSDAQPGTFTQLRRVAVDSNGNVFGADLWGERVEEWTRSAAGYTYSATLPNPFVGHGESSTTLYNQVRGIGFDASGDLVSMDTVNQRLVVMGPTGTLLGQCGERGFNTERERSTGLQLAPGRRDRPGNRRLLGGGHQAERRAGHPAVQREHPVCCRGAVRQGRDRAR